LLLLLLLTMVILVLLLVVVLLLLLLGRWLVVVVRLCRFVLREMQRLKLLGRLPELLLLLLLLLLLTMVGLVPLLVVLLLVVVVLLWMVLLMCLLPVLQRHPDNGSGRGLAGRLQVRKRRNRRSGRDAVGILPSCGARSAVVVVRMSGSFVVVSFPSGLQRRRHAWR